jgi:hypothetical protein
MEPAPIRLPDKSVFLMKVTPGLRRQLPCSADSSSFSGWPLGRGISPMVSSH